MPTRVFADTGRQLGDSGGVEQGANGKVDVQARVDRGYQAHREDAVAAEVEEGVVDPYPFQPEDLSVDVGQDLFGGGGRGAVVPGPGVFGWG